MQRRTFLGLFAALPWLPFGQAFSKPNQTANSHYLLIPGYQVNDALKRGVVKGLMNHDKEQTLISRLDLNSGRIERRIMPIKGHEICVHPDQKRAVFACQSSREMVSFAIDDLAIEQHAKTYGEDFVGGGHALYSADGRYLITSERKRSGSYQGKKKSYYGQIVIRDGKTLKPIEAFSSHGILPHEIQFINSGRQIVVAHYGSVTGQGSGKNAIHTVEPSITVLDLESGQLLDKYVAPVNDYEIRHLAIRQPNLSRSISGFQPVTQTQSVTQHRQEKKLPITVKANQSHNDSKNTLIKDSVVAVTNRLVRTEKKQRHLPAPVFNWEPGVERDSANAFSERLKLYRSQSVVFEPKYDEAIVTVTEAHQIAVLNAADGSLKTTVDCRRFKLQRPRGLTLLNHPDYYAVAGSFHGVMIIQRGTHKPVKYFDTPLFQHSHITIA